MKITQIVALFALAYGTMNPAIAQTADPHHPQGNAPSAGSAPPASRPSTTGTPGPMDAMPAECRTMMQAMPQNCMGMMMKMMGGGMQHGAAMPTQSMSGAMRGNAEAMERMNGPMMEAMREADPDIAFMKGMIPHHQAAIDMARVVLEFGKDPQTRKLAEDVIREQTREIDEMKAWLAAKSK